MTKDYYLGLDIGTSSAGWAVTDEDYHLCKFKKKSMWGVRLFDEAKVAQERRISRTSRRRLERRKARIDLLQELFSEEIARVDPNFFLRLNESRLHLEDKSIPHKFPLFIDRGYTDIDFHKEYPTAFHLRKTLIEDRTPRDPRFVYLALHHIIKSRGHFLIDGDLSQAKDFQSTLDQLLPPLIEEFHLQIPDMDLKKREKMEGILTDKKLNRSSKAKGLFNLFAPDRNSFEDELAYKRQKNIMDQVSKLLAGNKADLTKLFDLEKDAMEGTSVSFSDLNYEEKRSALDAVVPEQAYLVDKIKALYDWSILVDILKDEDYLSFAKVKQYDHHAAQLFKLRTLLKKYLSRERYKAFFNDEKGKNNYASLVGMLKKNGKKYSVKKCAEEDFYKNLRGILSKLTVEEADQSLFEEMMEGANLEDLLPLQRSKENAAVPHQVHELELHRILENASSYLSFLKEIDENGLSNRDKIEKIFKYRVPYFVGPLNESHKSKGANVWLVRRIPEGKIYPWNIEKMVDFKASNQAFIQRMTAKCSYLIGEDVLPKQSLLYSKFMVLNELNNLKIRGNKISEDVKRGIYTNLFQEKLKVTGKNLFDYLLKSDSDLALEDLSGFDQNFKSSLTSYLDFKKKVFGEKIELEEYQEIAENIIRWITIYGNDKKMLREMVTEAYGEKLKKEELSAILKLNYSGWGNFSKAFLKEVKGIHHETGEFYSIIDCMWQSNHNLMQVLSGKFSFGEEIEKINREKASFKGRITYDAIVKDLYVSPANKRAIWQTLKIAEEIKKVMGKVPKKIFIEMARGQTDKNKKNQRTVSRKEKLLALYKQCQIDSRDWVKEIESINERDFNSLKLYLYYTQMGKCMYTGEEIKLEELMRKNSKWDRDHIFPQSKIKDDSIDNLVLVNKVSNSKKSNELLKGEIREKMKDFWKRLLKEEFISKKKYERLMRSNDFSEEELAGFINRQLVETRQSSKAVAEIFKNIYPETEIVYVKASLVSDFRKDPLYRLKSRLLNDYHHAKDAYLNIVVGNVYNAKFTSNPIHWFRKNRDSDYSINAVFKHDLYVKDKCIWKAQEKTGRHCHGGTLDLIRETVDRDDVLYTEMSYSEKGELFNATIQAKSDSGLIPIKKGLNPVKYGGYNSANTSYFILVEYDGKKKEERKKMVLGVPIYIDLMLKHDKDALMRYLHEVKNMENVKILHNKIKKNAMIVFNGYPVRVRGENDKNILLKNNLQLRLSLKEGETLRRIEKFFNKGGDFEPSETIDRITHEDLLNLYDVLLEKLETVYHGRPANQSQKLKDGRERFKNSNQLKEKMLLIKNLLTFFRTSAGSTSDLRLVGGSEFAGGMYVNKNTFGASKLILVNQSVTGLFETREVL